jgi:hypothetical protein
MLTGNELTALADDKEVKKAIQALRTDFNTLEKDFENIIEEDFIALIFLSPAVGLALANRQITFFEELMLNRKARQLSRHSYFIEKDPIVFAMKYLVIHFPAWENKFYAVIALILATILAKNEIVHESLIANQHLDNEELILDYPPLFVSLLAFLFLENEENFFNTRKVSVFDYKKILEIAKKLNITELPLFQRFYETFEVG